MRGNAGSLADIADRSAVKLDALGEALVRRAASFRRRPTARLATVDATLGEQRENLVRTLEKLGSRGYELGQVLRGQADHLNGVVAEAGERLSEVGAQFDRQAREAADAATVASQRIGETGTSLRRRSDELQAAGAGRRHEARRDRRELPSPCGRSHGRGRPRRPHASPRSVKASTYAPELGVAMDAAERRIAEAERLLAHEAETLDAAASKVTRDASEATDAFRRQADDLAAGGGQRQRRAGAPHLSNT